MAYRHTGFEFGAEIPIGFGCGCASETEVTAYYGQCKNHDWCTAFGGGQNDSWCSRCTCHKDDHQY